MPKVCMYEVPDQEDDTSFMMNMKTKFAPTVENHGDLANSSRTLTGRREG